ncbi:hypothetical protein O6H91_Y202700 [Diphasiastrum complanatum]|nr:hypothetical protein O6H91_Y202700 [Diphasiastrum complanatum]
MLHGELIRVSLQNKNLQSTIDMMKVKGMQDLHSQQDVESKISSLAKEVEETRTWASALKQDANSSNQVQPSLVNSTLENVFTKQERRANKLIIYELGVFLMETRPLMRRKTFLYLNLHIILRDLTLLGEANLMMKFYS